MHRRLAPVLLIIACGCGGGDDAAPPAAPTVMAVAPDYGVSRGGARLTITGTGFVADQATVTVGGSAATDVTVVNATTITCTAPAGSDGTVDVVAGNANGTGTLAAAFTYFSGFFAADGKQGMAGNLYRVDPSDASTTTIGPIGFGITGLAFAPDGTLYGVESGGRFARTGSADIARLFTINPLTGTGTVVGTLETAASEQRYVNDITFLGDRLVGISVFPGLSFVVEIDPATAAVTLLPALNGVSTRYNLTANRQGTVYHLTPAFSGARLYTVVVDTGAVTEVVQTTGFVGTAGTANTRYNTLAFHEGQLYAIDNAPITGPSTLITIDFGGTRAEVGALPDGIDALASTDR